MTVARVLRASLAVVVLICLSACDGCPGASDSGSSDPGSSDPAARAPGSNASAPPSAGASKSSAPGAPLRVRVKRGGPRTLGQDFALFEDSVLPHDPQRRERVATQVSALLRLLDKQRSAREAAGQPDLSIDFVVNPDVHPTGLVDLATLACAHTSGDFRFLTDAKDPGVKLEALAAVDCAGPKAPPGWSCAGVKQSKQSVVLHIRGDSQFEQQQTTVIPVTLEHNGSAPDWAGLTASIKQAPEGANCLRWTGAGDLLSVDQLLHGVALAWRELGRRVPVVYVPMDVPE